MWDHLLIIALAFGGILLLLIVDGRTTRFVPRLLQAKPPRQPKLIDLENEIPPGVDDPGPTWLMLTSATPAWSADDVAEVCSRVWNVPVNQHEHDFNFVIGEAPCLMLRHGDWYYLLTIGDEPYMDLEQIPESTDATLRQAYAQHQSWFSLSVVGTPSHESLHSPEALQRSAQLVAALTGDIGLVLLGAPSAKPVIWTRALAQELRSGILKKVQ